MSGGGAVITKRLGIIGGLGPLATVYFYELVTKMTDAAVDQEHLEMIILSKPSIPDRTEYILGRSMKNPAIPIIEAGKTLVSLGVDCIAIPCITAHYFHDILANGIEVPIIHIIQETAKHLKEHGIRCAGIMATEGTIYSNIFQVELEEQGINTVIPSGEKQDYVTDLIYRNVKASRPVEMELFHQVSEELRTKGAQVIILGCTELSLIKRDYSIGAGYLDAMEVLAMNSILLCDGKLKNEYKSLIT
ncbi:amino acid racemase [Mobilitalea sibirica]|uniref:Amino acid racemase n=1 Tax=Mobilitalea sibirica TaxID=1462919 RepID=A0A8J7H0T2_9FIRM|nr:amino acid racemase [Mobilitalea sibirica]MBH1939808.1 amino acid racemase [Mobilitalea sibirica]